MPLNTSPMSSPTAPNTWTQAQTFNAQVNLYSDNKIQSSAPNDWWVSTGQGSFNGHADDLMFIGYNQAGSGAIRTAGDYALSLGFERDYWTSGVAHQAEFYLQYQDAAFNVRPYQAIIDHITHVVRNDFRGITYFNKDDGTQIYVMQTNGQFTIGGVAPQILFNTGSAIIQATAAGSSIALIANTNKYVWISKDYDGLEFGSGKDTAIYRFGTKLLTCYCITEGWRVDGNGAQTNLGLIGSSAYGGGVGVIGIKSATTVPASNPSGGGVLYVEAGALKYRGSSGTVTVLGVA